MLENTTKVCLQFSLVLPTSQVQYSQRKKSNFQIKIFHMVCHSSCYCSALNHLIIIGKCYLFVNANGKHRFQSSDLVSLNFYKWSLEKHFAFKSGEVFFWAKNSILKKNNKLRWYDVLSWVFISSCFQAIKVISILMKT